MLMVIFGAGASYDSSTNFRPPESQSSVVTPGPPPGPWNPREFWRPPLATQLFADPNGLFGEIVKKYGKLKPILPRLQNPSSRGVEAELESLQRQGEGDPERKRQLFAVRYYLRDLLTKITDEWLAQTNGVTNYGMLLDQIRLAGKPTEPICLVTFNYDLLLDRALEDSFDYKKPQTPAEQFNAHPRFKLFKPHGSVDWGKFVIVPDHRKLRYDTIIELADTIELSREFTYAGTTETYPQDRSVFPALAIPFQTKTEDTFEWPDSHRAYLEELLPSVTKILTIGWQAKEAHFLQMLRDGLPKRGRGVAHIYVVGREVNNARETLKYFAGELGQAPYNHFAADGGFRQFVANQEGKAFFRA